MRSKTAKRIYNSTPESVRQEVREHANQLHKMSDKTSQRMYSDPIPDHIEIMTIKQWKKMIKHEDFDDNDGTGYWCKDGMVSHDDAQLTPKLDATHVAWYNK